VIYTATRPFLIIKNLLTDSDIFVTEKCNSINFGNQGHSHGTLFFSTIAFFHIRFLRKRILLLCKSNYNFRSWHDTSPAYLYSSDNWHSQQ